jgi:multicomponent Na+:H+ antiporter subunit D
MTQHYPALLVAVPLLSAFLISAAGWIKKELCFPFALLGLGVSAFSSVGLLLQVLDQGPALYELGGWPAPFGISYRIDLLNGLVLVVVSAVALINLTATHRSVQRDFPEKIGGFYTLYVLFTTGLMGMVVTGDLFNLYVLLEIASLTGYALIALGTDRAPLASLNYVFMGTIGASFYLLGVGYLYIKTGSLNMADVASILPGLHASETLLVAFIFCMVGVWIKMAFFPLHFWLPNAYAYAPPPAASLIAPLMTKVMVYVMIRLLVSVFSAEFAFQTLGVARAVVWLSCLAILMGAFLALMQTDFRKMLGYIIVSEVGYMVGGMWLGNRAGLIGSILHIMNDAIMTLCLFLVVGNLSYRMQRLDRGNLKGLFRKMPFTMAGLVAGGLSIIGIPPTCGFFSKWYLLSGAFQAGHYGFMTALLISSLVNVILFFRIIEVGYFEPFLAHQGSGSREETVTEAPLTMTIPLLFVATGLLAVGLYSGDIVTKIIEPFVSQGMG